MNFRILDEAGKIVAEGRDLDEIRRELRIEVRRAFETLPPAAFHRDEVKRWDFGDLPDKIEVKRHGLSLAGFPALVEEGRKIAVRTLDSHENATIATRAGVRRLFMTQLQPELRRIVRTLPSIESISINYTLIGKPDDGRNDLASTIADRACNSLDFRSICARAMNLSRWPRRAGACSGRRRRRSISTSPRSFKRIAASRARSRKLTASRLQPSVNDMRQQAARLIYPGFITLTPYDWLQHLPRFVRGMEVR